MLSLVGNIKTQSSGQDSHLCCQVDHVDLSPCDVEMMLEVIVLFLSLYI